MFTCTVYLFLLRIALKGKRFQESFRGIIETAEAVYAVSWNLRKQSQQFLTPRKKLLQFH
jgi:hypothetical protein